MDDRRLLRVAGLAVPAAVWILGLVAPRQGGLTPAFVLAYTGLLAGLALVDLTAPQSAAAPLWRRLVWLGAELALCFWVVQVHGTLIRPALIYLLPASRAVVTFGERGGLGLSLGVWLAYGLNVGLYAWPDRLGEFPNYFSFFLAPYAVAVVLTLAVVRQAADRRQVQALYDELRQTHEELQALHGQAREAAVVEERNRLAREIHDALAHYLTVINVQLEAAEKLGADQPARALQQVQRARRLTLECLQEVRRSVAALRASTLEELALPRALYKLAADFAETTGIEVRLDLAADAELRLSPETKLALYRTAQEGLTNVQRHARAATAQISLRRRDGQIELLVEDDGVGPGSEAAGTPGGFGLLGLRERVELLGGRLGFARRPTGGSRLEVILPLMEAG
jgi:signal transduction histidine kinase